jgi:hypothetical protein
MKHLDDFNPEPPQIKFCSDVEPLPVAFVRECNPHFEDNPIGVFQFRAYSPEDGPARDFGFSHWVEVRARSEQFGGREFAAIFNYCPVENSRPNPYHKGVVTTIRKGWSIGCN